MQLPDALRQRLRSEFRFALGAMAQVPEMDKKLYFYSAFYGEVNRALNYYWDADLALLHMVLNGSHTTIKGRVDIASVGGDGAVELPTDFVDAWLRALAELTALFDGDGPIERAALHQILARIAEITYTTTGNGFYLYIRGAIPLRDPDSPTEPALPSARSRGAAPKSKKRP